LYSINGIDSKFFGESIKELFVFGCVMIVDWEKIGYPIHAIVLVEMDYAKVKQKHLPHTALIDLVLKKLPNVSTASIVTGHHRDMIIRLHAKSVEDLNRHTEAMRTLDTILATDTSIILQRSRQKNIKLIEANETTR
jgi:DNA-binding Lrp family transcriptional regulator